MLIVSFYFLVLILVVFMTFNAFFDLNTEHRLTLFLFLTGLACFYSLIAGYTQVFYTSLISFMTIILAYIWNKYVFSRLTIERKLSKDKIFIGEKVYFEILIQNKKLLPIPFINIKEYVTDGIEFINDKFFFSVPGKKANIYSDKFSLNWYEKVKRKYEILPQHRGYYKFGEGNAFFNGVFGLFKNQTSLSDYTELVVLPRILSADKMDIEIRQLFGSHPAEGWVHRDPLNKVGVRPYQTTDSIKEINWKASARHKKLESDVYKPSYDKEVHIFLSNLTTRDWWEGIIRNRLELAIIYAASLANYGIDNGYQVGLYSDGLIHNSSRHISLPPGKSSSHKSKILTTLAMIKASNQAKFSEILAQEKKNINSGSTVIIIGSYLSSETKKLINLYKKNYNLHIIKIDSDKSEKNKLTKNTYFVDEEKRWDQIKQLDIYS